MQPLLFDITRCYGQRQTKARRRRTLNNTAMLNGVALSAVLCGWRRVIVDIGENYNWKHSPQDQLVYLGKKGLWHQFRKIGDPRDVWCEVLDEDLHMIEETKERSERLGIPAL